MFYDYEDYFPEPNEFEMQIEEFKSSLRNAVKEEVKEKIESLKKELAELKEFRDERDRFVKECEAKIKVAQQEATKAKIEARESEEKWKNARLCKQSCVSWEEMRKYVGTGIKEFYGWHISDLVIYQDPNEIGEFFKACDKPPFTDCTWCIEKRDCACQPLKRQPQSWCYVEEIKN